MLRFMITTTPLSTSLQNLKKQSPFGARGKQERIVCHCQITQTSLSLSLSLSLFQAATMVGSTVFTLAEVASHDNRNDCWLIIEDKVYDVTKFLEDHPGGDEVLLSAIGKDATNDFFDVGHSSAARAMMEEFYVGDIDSSTIPTKRKYTPPKQPQYNQDKTPEFIIKVLQFLAPLVILALAFGIHLYTKTT